MQGRRTLLHHMTLSIVLGKKAKLWVMGIRIALCSQRRDVFSDARGENNKQSNILYNFLFDVDSEIIVQARSCDFQSLLIVSFRGRKINKFQDKCLSS